MVEVQCVQRLHQQCGTVCEETFSYSKTLLVLSGIYFALVSLSKTLTPCLSHGFSCVGDPTLSLVKWKYFFHLGVLFEYIELTQPWI